MKSIPLQDHSLPGSGTKQRLQSLDVFRGAVIMSMVLVNCPGDLYVRYRMLTHAVWNGWTFTDLIAPAFFWIIGVSMVYSLKRRLGENRKYLHVFTHIVRRSLIIFLIGFALQYIEMYGSQYTWSSFKYMGVLQRIGVSYLFAATLFLVAGIRGHAVWAIAGPLVYWVVLMSLPVPGYGAGNLDPSGNAASYIDLLLLGQHGGNPHSLLSLLTSTATISFGVITGFFLNSVDADMKKTAGMLVAGAVLVLLGELAGQWMPINRRLWTPSFMLLTAGISSITFGVCYLIVEVVGLRKWTKPFMVFGMNPIVIFSFSILFMVLAGKKGVTLSDGKWVTLWDYAYRMIFLKIAGPINASLLFSIAYVLIFLILGYIMYRRKWFVKV